MQPSDTCGTGICNSCKDEEVSLKGIGLDLRKEKNKKAIQKRSSPGDEDLPDLSSLLY